MSRVLPLTKTLIFSLLTLGCASILYLLIQQQTLSIMCQDNLRRLYMSLEMYEFDRGTLPHAAFFPNDPKQDGDSLRTLLDSYGAEAMICVCPTAYHEHRDLGLTYLWNVRLNGSKLASENEPTWMLVEINALSDQVPASHLGKYNILMSDGKIARSARPPQGVR